MFSTEAPCIYQKNCLIEVLCQLRFPEILSIGANLPVEFQEAIRGEFPHFSTRKEAPAPKLTGTPGNMTLEKQPPVTNYQFASADGLWRVNLTDSFISLSCRKYTCWEDFAQHLDKPLASFIKLYSPAFFSRVGLRYVNAISRRKLELEDCLLRDLIQPCYLGVLQEEDVSEKTVSRATTDAELAIRGGCRAKIHAGPGLVNTPNAKDPEVKFIFDMDLFMKGNVPVNLSAGSLQTLHGQAYSIFRGAITDTLHHAMEPTFP